MAKAQKGPITKAQAKRAEQRRRAQGYETWTPGKDNWKTKAKKK